MSSLTGNHEMSLTEWLRHDLINKVVAMPSFTK